MVSTGIRPRAVDSALVLLGVAAAEFEVWVANDVPGPRLGRWLPLLLLLALPLFWARRRPLAACALVLGGIAANSLAQGSPEGFELIVPLAVVSYAVAAYGTRRSGLVGFSVLVAGYVVYALEDPNVTHGTVGDLWAAAFFGVAMLALWLLGTWMRSRRETAVLEREAESAVTEERARMARELHDIVSHNLSVVVLQAAGARAAGTADGALEKIERSGREALVEMRRLLGVLREDGDGGALAPQPGLGQLAELAENVRAAGLPVELEVGPGCDGLPPAVELSAYRIVQEALTNALKHAGHARARVVLRREGAALAVEVVDDGTGTASAGDAGGHGLVGMRERVSLFGGSLEAGPRPEGGFRVAATLPVAP